MRKIIIHLGMAKSASTYLQNIAIQNKEVLGRHGFVYIHEFRSVSRGASDLARFFSESLSSNPAYNLLVSSENFFNPNDYDDNGAYTGAITAATYLKQAIGLLPAETQYTFVYVARNLLDFYVSKYAQLRKQGVKIDPIEYFSNIDESALSFKNILRALGLLSSIGKVHVIDFGLIEISIDRFVESFFGTCRISPAALSYATSVVNSSINDDGMMILEISKSSLNTKQFLTLRKLVQAYFPKNAPFPGEDSFRMTMHQQAHSEFRRFLELSSFY